MLTNGVRTKRLQTKAKTAMQLAAYCMTNKDKLTGRTLRDIGGEVRKYFAGEIISDGSISLACEAAEIVVARRTRDKPGHANRRNTVRALAAILDRFIAKTEEAIGAKPGSLLDEADERVLSKIRGGHSLESDS